MRRWRCWYCHPWRLCDPSRSRATAPTPTGADEMVVARVVDCALGDGVRGGRERDHCRRSPDANDCTPCACPGRREQGARLFGTHGAVADPTARDVDVYELYRSEAASAYSMRARTWSMAQRRPSCLVCSKAESDGQARDAHHVRTHEQVGALHTRRGCHRTAGHCGSALAVRGRGRGRVPRDTLQPDSLESSSLTSRRRVEKVNRLLAARATKACSMRFSAHRLKPSSKGVVGKHEGPLQPWCFLSQRWRRSCRRASVLRWCRASACARPC